MESNLTAIYSRRLRDEYGYPSDSIKEQVAFAFGKARYKVDVVVYKEAKPYIVAEASSRIGDFDAVSQLQAYVRASNAEFAVITNGYIDSCFKTSNVFSEGPLEPIPDIPKHDKTLDDIGRQENSELVKMNPLQFQEIILNVRDSIYLSHGLSRYESTREMVKLLLLKVYDETLDNGLFRARYGEPAENVRARIVTLTVQAREKYPSILNEPPNLSDELLAKCVNVLQKYSLHDSGISTIGSKFPIFQLLGYPGRESSTRPEVIKLMLDLLNPAPGSSFIDPACGVGDLITEAARRGCQVTGVELNADTAQYAKANLALSGLSGNVIIADSLNMESGTDSLSLSQGGFDFAAVDPPIGARVDDSRLDKFALGRAKKTQNSEALFLEFTYGLIKPSGKMAIMLPDAFLSSETTLDAREYALRETTIKAIVSLPQNASTAASIKASLMLLERSASRNDGNKQVFVGSLDSFSKAEQIVSAFRNYEQGQGLSANENTFVTTISSPRKMDVSFLQGASLENMLVKEFHYPIASLSEIAMLSTGAQLQRLGKPDANGKYRYIRAGDVGDFILNSENAEKISMMASAPDKWLAHAGDVLLTRTGTVGRVALVTHDVSNMIVGSNVTKISIRDGNRVLPEYVMAFLTSEQGTRQISMYTTGAPIMSISTSAIGQIKIPIPPLARQREIAEQVKRIIESKQEMNRVIENMRERENQLRRKLEQMTEASK